VNPIIKNIWTSSFALFSGGFALTLLGLLAPVTQAPGIRPALWPSRIFGENPLLAYILAFLIAPLIDARWINGDSLRNTGQAWFEQWVTPNAASLLFGLGGLALLFAILLVCHRKRWILKL
jgi:predicted acyltransferase